MVALAPLAPLALGCLAGAAWAEAQGWAFGVLALAFLIVGARRVSLFLIVLCALVVAIRFERLEEPVRESLAQPMSEFVTGSLQVGPRVTQLGRERYGKLRTKEGERRVVVMNASGYAAGQILSVMGKFFVPERERNPGSFQRLERWRRAGVFGGFQVHAEEERGWAWSAGFYRWAEFLRESLRRGMTLGLSEESAGRQVIQAMVLGEKPPRDSAVSLAFRESGAMHVFAVSGLHVTLVGSLFWVVFGNLPIPRRVAVLGVILVMLSYAMVTGLRPPAVRATVMAICFLGAFVLRRRPSLFNALALSAMVVILWRPSQVYEVGFQLSYGVLLTIGLGVAYALRVTGKIAELDPFFPSRLLTDRQMKFMKARKFLAELSASSFVAWLGSLPLMLWHFGFVTPIAVVASLFLIPATWVILALAFLSVLLGTLSQTLSFGVNRVNEAVGNGAYHLARGFSKVPFGHWQAREMAPADWVVFDCHDGGAASFLNVGGGVMVDVGGERFFERELAGILGRWNVSLKTVFLTHPDGDHVGALPSLLERGGLEKVLLPVEEALSPNYREFLAKAEESSCLKVLGKAGERYDLSEEVFVEIVSEGSPFEREIADNRVMVMRVHWKGWRVLVTGDLGIGGEQDLVKAGVNLEADVVLMGQHEWGVSGQQAFLEATGAKIIITSAGQLPKFQMPKRRWVKRVRSQGYQLFNQWESGAVMLDFSRDELRVWSYLRPGEEVILQR